MRDAVVIGVVVDAVAAVVGSTIGTDAGVGTAVAATVDVAVAIAVTVDTGVDPGLQAGHFAVAGIELPAFANLFGICAGCDPDAWALARRLLCAKTYLALPPVGTASS